MQAFQPIGYEQFSLDTVNGAMVYLRPKDSFWPDVSTSHSPMVFFHSLGGGSSSYEWSKVFPAFAATHLTIAPDLVGWGDSAHPARYYIPQDYLEQFLMLLKQVVKEPAWVIASSLTAALAIRLAIQHPQLFKGLFLVCPSGYRDFGRAYQSELLSPVISLPGIDRLFYLLGAANELAVRNFLEQFLFAQRSRVSEEIVAAYLASATKPNAEFAALSTLKGDICFDLSDEIPKLQVPTVFVWGEKSRFNSPEQGRRLAKLNSTTVNDFHVIPDTGVLPHLEKPEMVIGLLASYVSN